MGRRWSCCTAGRCIPASGGRSWRSSRAIIASMRSTFPDTAAARRSRRARSMRSWLPSMPRLTAKRSRSRCSAGRWADWSRCSWAIARPARVSTAGARLHDAAVRRRADWPHAMAEATLARFGDELHVAWKLTVQRFLALQVHNSEHGRATLAAMREQLWARGEPSRPALAATLAVLATADLRARCGTASRNRRWSLPAAAIRCAGPRRGAGSRRRCPMRASWKSRARRTRRSCRTATSSWRRSRHFLVSTEPRFPPPDPRDVDPRAVRRAFARAAATYDAAAVLQREVGSRMASRLDYIKVAPRTILDAGCGTGEAVGELGVRYAGARVVALDAALPMVAAARERARRARSLFRRLLPDALRGGGHAAPRLRLRRHQHAAAARRRLRPGLEQPRAAMGERPAARVRGGAPRAEGGRPLTFTTFGPDTLKEIRSAFARADGHTHTNRFTDMHDIGDMLVAAGFADPVMDMEQLTLTYADANALMRELKHDRRHQRDARAAAWADGPRTLAARAGRARGAAPRRPDSGDLRGRLRPRVEGRAAADAGRAPDRQAHAPRALGSRWLAEFSSRAPIRAWERPWPPSRCCARSPLPANALPA